MDVSFFKLVKHLSTSLEVMSLLASTKWFTPSKPKLFLKPDKLPAIFLGEFHQQCSPTLDIMLIAVLLQSLATYTLRKTPKDTQK
jgi:hypothetical protein